LTCVHTDAVACLDQGHLYCAECAAITSAAGHGCGVCGEQGISGRGMQTQVDKRARREINGLAVRCLACGDKSFVGGFDVHRKVRTASLRAWSFAFCGDQDLSSPRRSMHGSGLRLEGGFQGLGQALGRCQGTDPSLPSLGSRREAQRAGFALR